VKNVLNVARSDRRHTLGTDANALLVTRLATKTTNGGLVVAVHNAASKATTGGCGAADGKCVVIAGLDFRK
jgi:hypothetical protein